jgi:hypothetical protein
MTNKENQQLQRLEQRQQQQQIPPLALRNDNQKSNGKSKGNGD